MDFFKDNKRYFITFAIAAIVAALIYFNRDLQPIADNNMTLHALADALFVPGVMLFGFGTFLLVSNEGIFNGVSYGLKAIWKALTDIKNPKMDESYYDYHVRKTGHHVRFGHYMIVGGIFIVASVIVAMMV